MIANILKHVMRWAVEKNGNVGYRGEDAKAWAYTIAAPDGSPYLSRLLLPRIRLPYLGTVRPMLHQFHRPDDDRELHNHPWARAWSLILTGSYVEERLADPVTGTTATKIVRWFNALTDRDFHRVVSLHGDVFTLFVTGDRVQDWGFYDVGRDEFTPHRDFFKKKEMSQHVY